MTQLDRIEKQLDVINEKLDTLAEQTAEHRTMLAWIKWALGGAWVAIASLFTHHK